MNGIGIKNATKKYGSTVALDNVSLEFRENKIYGLLGRNGAGKSTLLNGITGRIFFDSGSITVDGEACIENDNALNKIYMMSENTYYPQNMKIRNAFKWTGEFYENFDINYADKLCGEFKLDKNKSIKSLSTGYNSIFKLIIALSTNAPFIMLDEPVLGLDANHRDLLYRLILEKYMKQPFTLVISTHLVEEISTIIEDVIIIKNGRIIYNEPCQELLEKGYTITGPVLKIDQYIENKKILGSDSLGGLKTAYIMGKPEDIPDGAEISKLDLQKLFIQLTND